MIGKLFGYAGSLSVTAAAGYAGYSYINSAQFRNQYADPNSLEEESFGYGMIKGTFGGENLFMNLGAEFGSRWAAGHMRKKALGLRREAASRRRGAMRVFGFNKNMNLNDTWTNTRTGVGILDKGPKNSNANSFLRKKSKISPAAKSAYRGTRMAAAGARRLEATAKNLRKVGKLAAWAPLAFMAFDMVSALGNMPAPSSAAIPRKSAGLSGTFMDTGMAYTQRQRALQAMHNSQYAGRSALGNEASLMHR